MAEPRLTVDDFSGDIESLTSKALYAIPYFLMRYKSIGVLKMRLGRSSMKCQPLYTTNN